MNNSIDTDNNINKRNNILNENTSPNLRKKTDRTSCSPHTHETFCCFDSSRKNSYPN